MEVMATARYFTGCPGLICIVSSSHISPLPSLSFLLTVEQNVIRSALLGENPPDHEGIAQRFHPRWQRLGTEAFPRLPPPALQTSSSQRDPLVACVCFGVGGVCSRQDLLLVCLRDEVGHVENCRCVTYSHLRARWKCSSDRASVDELPHLFWPRGTDAFSTDNCC